MSGVAISGGGSLGEIRRNAMTSEVEQPPWLTEGPHGRTKAIVTVRAPHATQAVLAFGIWTPQSGWRLTDMPLGSQVLAWMPRPEPYDPQAGT